MKLQRITVMSPLLIVLGVQLGGCTGNRLSDYAPSLVQAPEGTPAHLMPDDIPIDRQTHMHLTVRKPLGMQVAQTTGADIRRDSDWTAFMQFGAGIGGVTGAFRNVGEGFHSFGWSEKRYDQHVNGTLNQNVTGGTTNYTAVDHGGNINNWHYVDHGGNVNHWVNP